MNIKGIEMNKHVDFSNEDIVIIRHSQLKQFVFQSASNTDNHKYRFCMHDSPNNALQEMFIVRSKGDYCRPDRHSQISESHMLMCGEEAVILFDDEGQIQDIIFLSKEKDVLAYRINAPVYHMTVTLSDWAIDYEVKPGPFTQDMNEFPDWAPKNDEHEKIEEFMGYITREIEKWKLGR